MKIKGLSIVRVVGFMCGAVLALLVNFGYQELVMPDPAAKPETGAQLQPHEQSKPPESGTVQTAPPVEKKIDPYPQGLSR